MRTRDLLPIGTVIRTLVPAMDSGDFSDRHCPAGSVGFIEDHYDQESCYLVIFKPSWVIGLWSPAEIASDAEILPPDHPDIPSKPVIDLAYLAYGLLYDFQHNADAKTFTITRSAVANLLATAVGLPAERVIRDIFRSVEDACPHGAHHATISYADVDRISEATGYAERCSYAPDKWMPTFGF